MEVCAGGGLFLVGDGQNGSRTIIKLYLRTAVERLINYRYQSWCFMETISPSSLLLSTVSKVNCSSPASGKARLGDLKSSLDPQRTLIGLSMSNHLIPEKQMLSTDNAHSLVLRCSEGAWTGSLEINSLHTQTNLVAVAHKVTKVLSRHLGV